MDFGNSRELSDKQYLIESFVNDFSEELNLIYVYLFDMDKFFNEKSKEIKKELQDEEKLIKESILNQPNYKLYDKAFNDIVYKNILVSLISKLEFKLEELLLVLDKSKLDTLKKKKSKKQIKKQPNIILMLECLEEFFNADLELFKNKIGLFIRFRNSIVHKGSKLFESEHYKDFIDCIDIEKDIFYFKDLKFSLLLLEEISTLFNFITKCNSDI